MKEKKLPIEKILKKRTWSCEDVGRIELSNSLYIYEQILSGVKEPEQLIDDEEFRIKSETAIKTESVTYSRYTKLYEWLSKNVNRAYAYVQQMNLHFKTLSDFLINAMAIEKTYFYISELPRIVTQKQYDEMTKSEKDKADNSKIFKNGIAVLLPDENCKYIDEKGYYNPRKVLTELERLSLDGLFPESRYYEHNKKQIKFSRKIFVESYYYLLGYNKILDMIKDYYGIEHINAMQFEIDDLVEKVEAMNTVIYSLDNIINECTYDNEEYKAKKLKALNDFFPLLDLAKLNLSTKLLDVIESNFEDFKAFRFDKYDPINLLCFSYEYREEDDV